MPDTRRKLEELYAIPAVSWDEPAAPRVSARRAPSEPPAPVIAEPKTPSEPPPPKRKPGHQAKMVPTRVEEGVSGYVVTDQMKELDLLISECKRGMTQNGLSVAESASWQKRLMDALAARQKALDAHEIRLDAVARSDAWKQVKEATLGALTQHPDALRDCLAAWAELQV